jgi:hypothetical protein
MLMLKNLVTGKPSVLDESIDRVVKQMERVQPSSEDYQGLLTTLERLMTLKSEQKIDKISLDTLAVVAGNLLGILIIVGYERTHVVASRGLQVLLRTKHQ